MIEKRLMLEDIVYSLSFMQYELIKNKIIGNKFHVIRYLVCDIVFLDG